MCFWQWYLNKFHFLSSASYNSFSRSNDFFRRQNNIFNFPFLICLSAQLILPHNIVYKIKRRWGRGKPIQKNTLPLQFLFFTFLFKQFNKFWCWCYNSGIKKTKCGVAFVGQILRLIFNTAALNIMKCGVAFMLDPLGDLDKFWDRFYNTGALKRLKCGGKSCLTCCGQILRSILLYSRLTSGPNQKQMWG